MAAGSTISGQIRFARQKVNGDIEVIAGPFSSQELDHKADPQYSVWFNTPRERTPVGANVKTAKNAELKAGEILLLQHKAAALAEAADYDADEIFISILKKDINRNDIIPTTLTVADTGLSGDATTSTTAWVTGFQYTVPDRVSIALYGQCNVAVVETA